MNLKNMVTLAGVLFILFALFSNAVAQDMVHLAEYNLEGRIELIQVTGSNPGSGAQRKMLISGEGQLEKASHIVQHRGSLSVEDTQSWVTAVDALNNIKVFSTIELSTPPQIVFTTVRFVPLTEEPSDDEDEDDEEAIFDVIFIVEGNSRLAGVSIQVYADASFVTAVGDPVITDADGVAVKRLPRGDYWFRAAKAGFLGLEGSFTVTSEGVEGGSLDIDFTMTPEDHRKNPIADEAVQATAVVLGDSLEGSSLTGTFKDADTGAGVAGTLSWSNADAVVDASGYFEWVFSPTDDAAYHVVNGVVFVIAKCRLADKAVLRAEILLAEANLASVTVSVDGKDVPREELWVPVSVWGAYSSAVEEAQMIDDDECAEQVSVDQAAADLRSARAVFETHLSYGLLPEAVNIAAIEGVVAPVKGAAPVTIITESEQFTGIITWAPEDVIFQPDTIYTATVTLSPKEGYTFTGVAENFFSVTGAVSVTNTADSGEVVAVFPATEAKTYAIGDIGPSGVGIVFYVTDGGRHGFEAAPSGWHGDIDPARQWKNKNTETAGTSTAIGSGYANTYYYMVGDEHPAAAACRNYRSDIEGDWFLPSQDELNLMFLQKITIGGFNNYSYWSSSQATSMKSWVQAFGYGSQSTQDKIIAGSYRVRPIRSF